MKSYRMITACLLSVAMTATMPSYAWASDADITVFSDGQAELTDGGSTTDTDASDVENVTAPDAVSVDENAENLTDSSEVFNAGTENDETKDNIKDDTNDSTEKENQSDVFTILTDKMEVGHVNKPYSGQLESDSETPVKWKLCGKNELPNGFTLSEDGVLSGMPKRTGYYSFGVQADNGELLVYKQIGLRIEEREREQVPYRLELSDEDDQPRQNSDEDLGIITEDWKSDDPWDVCLVNTGTETLHPISETIEGTYFKCKVSDREEIEKHSYLWVRVSLQRQLPRGTYEEKVTVNTEEGASCDINLRLTVGPTSDKDYDLKLEHDTIWFTEDDYEWEEWTKGIYFRVTGQKDTTVTVDASELKHFVFVDEDLNEIDPGQINLKDLKPGDHRRFLITPKQEYGVYDEVVYLCINDGSRYPIHIKMDREEPDRTEHLQVTAEKKDFGTKVWKYNAPPEALSMEVKNVSQEDMTLYVDKSNSYFKISMPSIKTLKAGEAITINVQPKASLDIGRYSLELKIMAENSEGKIFNKSVDYKFVVSDEYFCGVVPSELQTRKHRNGVQKTWYGLDLPGYIRVYGAEKKTTFPAKVDWDIEHCAYQENSKKAQKFEVIGQLVFDDPETNGDHLDTTVKMPIEIAAYKKLNAPILGEANAPELSNEISVSLIEASAQAQGYQFVVVTDKKDLIKEKFAAEMKKKGMKEGEYTTLHYVQKGKYYFYCRGYKKKSDGTLEYGDWSKAQEVEIKKKTPNAPKIKKVEVKGSEVKITLDKPMKNGQFEAVAAKKNIGNEPKNCDAVVYCDGGSNVVYLMIPRKGTYYIGVKSSYTTLKIYGYEGVGPFSRWSNLVKVTTKTDKVFTAPTIKKVGVSGRNVTVKFQNVKGLTGSRWILANKVVKGYDGEYKAVKSTAYKKYTRDSSTITFENVKPGTYYLVGAGYKKCYHNIYTSNSQIKKVVVK